MRVSVVMSTTSGIATRTTCSEPLPEVRVTTEFGERGGLGPCRYGVRIGSNAVVVKSVPSQKTVVGVPGRLIDRTRQETKPHREAMAKKIGYDAYGATQDTPDPVANAINCMLDHIHAMDGQMQNMCKSLKALGSELDEVRLPDLGACDISGASEPEKLDTPSQEENIKENQEDK